MNDVKEYVRRSKFNPKTNKSKSLTQNVFTGYFLVQDDTKGYYSKQMFDDYTEACKYYRSIKF